ncbi:DUF1684 domain-containing protein [Nocardia thraciensis]
MSTVTTASGNRSAEEFEKQWHTWHAEREAWAREPLGWLSLTGLHWLGEADEAVEGIPGRWRVDGENVVVTADYADGLTLNGEPLAGRTELTPGEGAPGLAIRVGERSVDGSIVLDFNRAQNLPCAFTDYATCPVAPAENRLTVAVEAGEKNPRPEVAR